MCACRNSYVSSTSCGPRVVRGPADGKHCLRAASVSRVEAFATLVPGVCVIIGRLWPWVPLLVVFSAGAGAAAAGELGCVGVDR